MPKCQGVSPSALTAATLTAATACCNGSEMKSLSAHKRKRVAHFTSSHKKWVREVETTSSSPSISLPSAINAVGAIAETVVCEAC